jgi:hypothetical protein
MTGDDQIKSSTFVDDQAVMAEFSRRHKISSFLFLFCFAVFFFLPVVERHLHLAEGDGRVTDLWFFLVVVTAGYILLRYRCPRCNAIPNSSQTGTSGILLFPRKCSKCGAPLMPNHRWAQD